MAKFCPNCGKEVNENAAVCVGCGVALNGAAPSNVNVTINNGVTESPKSRLVAFLLCTFLGVIGVHRFYVGKVGTGIVWILTFGCFGIGVLIDWVMILCGTFKDGNGQPITNWNS